MKKILFYIFAVNVLTLFSCDENFLQVNPHDKLSEGTFWKTEQDAKLAIAGVYSSFYGSYFDMGNYPGWDGLSDNAYAINNRSGIRSAMTAPLNSNTGGIVNNFYIDAYRRIANCNYFLENIDNVKGLDETTVDTWKAEALLIRAWFYYYLTEFYGDVPIILNSYEIGSDLLPREPKSKVITQVHTDLDFAIANLPDASYVDGHFVKYTAMAIKAKVYLSNNLFSETVSLTKQIMDSDKFSLFSDYKTLFLTKGQGSSNKEILLSVRYILPDLEHAGSLWWGWWRSLGITQNLADDYECIDGLPISSSPLYNAAEPYENRDPRLHMTWYMTGYPWPYRGEGYPIFYSNYVPSPLKGSLSKYVEDDAITVAQSEHVDNDIILIRYADIMLMYAEAKNEIFGPDESIYGVINDIRARVGMPSISNDKTKEQMRETIRHERRIELAGESMRWLDLKRWGQLERIGTIGTDQVPVKYYFSSNNYLWPLPQSQVDYYKGHGSILQQNPGY